MREVLDVIVCKDKGEGIGHLSAMICWTKVGNRGS